MAINGHNPIQIAEYLLRKTGENDDYNTLTPMQLLKLVYMSHGWMLGLHGRPLINENIEAWQYGPVIPSLYEKIRQFRSSPVVSPLIADYNESIFENIEKQLMDQVIEIYRKYSGPALSRLTHASDTPWSRMWNISGWKTIIPNDLIEDHYANLYQKYDKA